MEVGISGYYMNNRTNVDIFLTLFRSQLVDKMIKVVTSIEYTFRSIAFLVKISISFNQRKSFDLRIP